MSIDFRGLQTSSDDPMARLIKFLERKLARFLTKDQVASVDSDNEDIYADGQDMESVIKFHSLLPYRITNYNVDYYPTFEPDGQFCKVFILGQNVGDVIPDLSGFNHHAHIVGDPFIVDGSMSLGTFTNLTLSFCSRYNPDFEHMDDIANTKKGYIYFDDHADLQVNDKISEMIRFRPLSLKEDTEDAETLIQKFDDNSVNAARRLFYTTGGRIMYSVNYAGVNYRRTTDFDTIVAKEDGDPPYEVWACFDPALIATNPIKIAVDGVVKTTTVQGPFSWDGDVTNHTLKLFTEDVEDGGFVAGDFYMYKMFKGMIVSDAQIGYHYANKWTIENIAFGHVMVIDNWDTNNSQV
jgi:hypothetical protein